MNISQIEHMPIGDYPAISARLRRMTSRARKDLARRLFLEIKKRKSADSDAPISALMATGSHGLPYVEKLLETRRFELHFKVFLYASGVMGQDRRFRCLFAEKAVSYILQRKSDKDLSVYEAATLLRRFAAHSCVQKEIRRLRAGAEHPVSKSAAAIALKPLKA
jgi:hypothetical protein